MNEVEMGTIVELKGVGTCEVIAKTPSKTGTYYRLRSEKGGTGVFDREQFTTEEQRKELISSRRD